MATNDPNGANKAKKRVGGKVLYSDLSYRVMEAVFEVHNQLGPGFTEKIYERALVFELEKRAIPFEKQKIIEVVYKGQSLGTYHLDLVVDNKIILELKAVAGLNDLFKQQLLSYLRATNIRLGVLINFGSQRVEYVRIVN
ncbi:MAG: GxxExxY protein [Chloroflexi bacterium]|nr:GxxExxY protein [Chloroflexota bacterium]